MAEDQAQVLALDDRVDGAMLEGELGPPGRNRVTDGFLVDARPNERDPGVGLGQDHISQAGERCEHSTHGRVREHSQQRHSLLPQPRGAQGGLCHLEQRHHPFLYAGAAG